MGAPALRGVGAPWCQGAQHPAVLAPASTTRYCTRCAWPPTQAAKGRVSLPPWLWLALGPTRTPLADTKRNRAHGGGIACAYTLSVWRCAASGRNRQQRACAKPWQHRHIARHTPRRSHWSYHCPVLAPCPAACCPPVEPSLPPKAHQQAMQQGGHRTSFCARARGLCALCPAPPGFAPGAPLARPPRQGTARGRWRPLWPCGGARRATQPRCAPTPSPAVGANDTSWPGLQQNYLRSILPCLSTGPIVP